MRVLSVGAGGVGTAAALIAARRDVFDGWVVADAVPFLDLLTAYGSPWGQREQ